MRYNKFTDPIYIDLNESLRTEGNADLRKKLQKEIAEHISMQELKYHKFNVQKQKEMPDAFNIVDDRALDADRLTNPEDIPLDEFGQENYNLSMRRKP